MARSARARPLPDRDDGAEPRTPEEPDASPEPLRGTPVAARVAEYLTPDQPDHEELSTMRLPVVVGVDTSAASLTAADWAATEAALRDRPLRVLHALPLMPHLLPSDSTRPLLDGSTLLHEVRHVLAVRHPQVGTHTEEVHDIATAALVAAAEAAELLVLAVRGDGGFPGLRVGSTALHVAARSSCPTVLVPAEQADPGVRDRIAAAVDARRPHGAVLDFAFDAARRLDLPLRVLHAFPASGRLVRADRREAEAALLRAVLEPWQDAHPSVEVIAEAEPAGAGPLLVEASAKARMLVVGRRPEPSVRGLGPVAHAVLHHAACPVAVVPGSRADSGPSGRQEAGRPMGRSR
jgi:nucleotide-binding universal stress UspA family protein